MTRIAAFLCTLLTAVLAQPLQAEVERRALNDGNLILEDIPAMPQTIVDDLNRYQNVYQQAVVLFFRRHLLDQD